MPGINVGSGRQNKAMRRPIGFGARIGVILGWWVGEWWTQANASERISGILVIPPAVTFILSLLVLIAVLLWALLALVIVFAPFVVVGALIGTCAGHVRDDAGVNAVEEGDGVKADKAAAGPGRIVKSPSEWFFDEPVAVRIYIAACSPLLVVALLVCVALMIMFVVATFVVAVPSVLLYIPSLLVSSLVGGCSSGCAQLDIEQNDIEAPALHDVKAAPTRNIGDFVSELFDVCGFGQSDDVRQNAEAEFLEGFGPSASLDVSGNTSLAGSTDNVALLA